MRGIGSNTYSNSSLHYQSQTIESNPGRMERDVEPPRDPEYKKRRSVAAKHAIEEMLPSTGDELAKLKQDKQSFLCTAKVSPSKPES